MKTALAQTARDAVNGLADSYDTAFTAHGESRRRIAALEADNACLREALGMMITVGEAYLAIARIENNSVPNASIVIEAARRALEPKP